MYLALYKLICYLISFNKMLENKKITRIKRGSEKNFGIVFGIVFIIISLFPLFNNESIRIWPLYFTFFFIFSSFFFPRILTIPNIVWFKLGILLNYITSPIIMAFLFFLVATPTGLIMRLIKKDLINQKVYKSKKSYWIIRKKEVEEMKNQF